jgi:hypothetical protein
MGVMDLVCYHPSMERVTGIAGIFFKANDPDKPAITER